MPYFQNILCSCKGVTCFSMSWGPQTLTGCDGHVFVCCSWILLSLGSWALRLWQQELFIWNKHNAQLFTFNTHVLMLWDLLSLIIFSKLDLSEYCFSNRYILLQHTHTHLYIPKSGALAFPWVKNNNPTKIKTRWWFEVLHRLKYVCHGHQRALLH